MSNKTNEERKQIKRENILKGARQVFGRKGLLDVTMKDIIDECGISRGGIYLYFDSVDAIFVAVIGQRSSRKFDGIRAEVKANRPFEELLAKYFAEHKDRLLNQVGNSLLRATYEYYYTHNSAADHAFQQAQISSSQQTIYAILQLGVTQGILLEQHLDELAETFMLIIEGLSVLAITGAITEKRINDQINMMQSLLPRK
ncbi:TetR/AcrR family transcriptional regulator [Loigolactobacillus jiayinensis]|mgnify:CR=1 FL=1|uniref:TetR/AcrR family transcriptional regulator n=1 Tax=Loigolactobacillus jiayinensis TaxID=2486016 RepID=A0ABW1RI94_9LACO|nr:TetR/AcrR family transcriptional regulator [Loigolactobacillus jiayinensis]